MRAGHFLGTEDQMTNRWMWMLAFLALALFSPEAMANMQLDGEPPPLFAPYELSHTQIFLAVGAIAVVMLCTAAGGGYSIIRAKAKLSPAHLWWRFVRVVFFAALYIFPFIAFSGSDAQIGLIVLLITFYALIRGGQLFWWAWQARAAQPGQEHLQAANPKRLKLSGAFLYIITLGFYMLTAPPALNQYREKALCYQLKSMALNMAVAQETYFTDYSTYLADPRQLYKYLPSEHKALFDDSEVRIGSPGEYKFMVGFCLVITNPGCDLGKDGKPDVIFWESISNCAKYRAIDNIDELESHGVNCKCFTPPRL